MSDWAKQYLDDKEEMMPDQQPKSTAVKDFLNSNEIRALGIKCGEGCLLHRTALVYNPFKIEFGKNVRVDAFNVLSAGEGFIHIGSYVHISSHCLFIGAYGIVLHDFTNIAAGSKLYSASDSFKGDALIGPTVPEHTRRVKKGIIVMHHNSTLGANCIMMPGSVLGYGSMMQANSLLVGETGNYEILAGQPAKKIKDSKKGFEQFLSPDGVLPQ